MSTTQQSPKVVIAARNSLIAQVRTIGGSRLTDAGSEEIADWMISSGYLAESFYEGVAAELDTPATTPGTVPVTLAASAPKLKKAES